MIDKYGNGLKYAGTKSKIAWYEMYVEHRVVFRVSIDEKDPELGIHVHRADGAGGYRTNGHAQMALHSYKKDGGEEWDVKVVEHVVSATIHSYVYPRLPIIMANLYVPKTSAEASETFETPKESEMSEDEHGDE